MKLTIEIGQENKMLRTPGIPVNSSGFAPPLQNLASLMHKMMKKMQGVGLAAPQIGKSLRLFIVDAAQMPKDIRDAAQFNDNTIAIANPLLLNVSGEETTMTEGCLSLPDVLVSVIRPATITVQGQNLKGERFTATVSDYAARILQHEMDHLDGILIVDKGTIVENEESEIL